MRRNDVRRGKRVFGWIGLSCLLLIIPVKAIRFVSKAAAHTLLAGIAPSVLGPLGFLFLLLSGSGRFSRLTPGQASFLVAIVALGLEFAQLLPRPGLLAWAHYTFDWLDVLASLVSVCAGYIVAHVLTKKHGADRDPEH